MDYFCLNRMPSSKEVVGKVVLKRFDELLGLDRSLESEMLQAIDEACKVDWPSRRREIVAMYLKLANHERSEIVSVIESFLWKIKEQIGEGESCEEIKSDAYSDEIKHVVSFCDNLDVDAYFVSFPDQFEFADEEEDDSSAPDRFESPWQCSFLPSEDVFFADAANVNKIRTGSWGQWDLDSEARVGELEHHGQKPTLTSYYLVFGFDWASRKSETGGDVRKFDHQTRYRSCISVEIEDRQSYIQEGSRCLEFPKNIHKNRRITANIASISARISYDPLFPFVVSVDFSSLSCLLQNKSLRVLVLHHDTCPSHLAPPKE
eukprot:scaffold6112_cov116-Cylindrotheca_fusiformis.AAC.2